MPILFNWLFLSWLPNWQNTYEVRTCLQLLRAEVHHCCSLAGFMQSSIVFIFTFPSLHLCRLSLASFRGNIVVCIFYFYWLGLFQRDEMDNFNTPFKCIFLAKLSAHVRTELHVLVWCAFATNDDVVLRHTLPVFTGLGRCPIVSWDFAGAVNIFGPDALPVVHQWLLPGLEPATSRVRVAAHNH